MLFTILPPRSPPTRPLTPVPRHPTHADAPPPLVFSKFWLNILFLRAFPTQDGDEYGGKKDGKEEMTNRTKNSKKGTKKDEKKEEKKEEMTKNAENSKMGTKKADKKEAKEKQKNKEEEMKKAKAVKDAARDRCRTGRTGEGRGRIRKRPSRNGEKRSDREKDFAWARGFESGRAEGEEHGFLKGKAEGDREGFLRGAREGFLTGRESLLARDWDEACILAASSDLGMKNNKVVVRLRRTLFA